ncbi:MAG: hypothetical protein E7288_07790 [Lachnospiraceae bacterium]|nr:hypothetical protein [Lachnospiraceae bacterium]
MKTISEIIRDVDTDEQLCERVENCLNGVKVSFIQLGYMLRILKERGFDNAALQDRFGLSKSTICRSIQLNEQFSENGYSYKLDEKYAAFNKSQLIEMLPLSAEQREEITEDMSVADIRELKNQEEEEPEEELEEDEEEEIDEETQLPTFNMQGRWSDFYRAIAKKLSELSEVGRNINKMIDYLNNIQDEKLYFVVDDINFYIERKYSALYISSDEYYVSYAYLGTYSLGNQSEFLEFSDTPFLTKIDKWSIRTALSIYLTECIDDWEYIEDHFSDIPAALFDNVPLTFILSDKYKVCVCGDSLDVSYKDYPDFEHATLKKKDFNEGIMFEFYNWLEELFLLALADNLRKFKHLYSLDDADLFLVDESSRLNFLFFLNKDGSIDNVYGLSGKDYDDAPLEYIELHDYFSDWDVCALRVFFLSCTNKKIQDCINAYKKPEKLIK